MKFTTMFKTASALAVVAALTGGAYADDHVHPETGEKLAADQTFTYRLLDGLPTLDPQLNEDVSGSDVIRDLFEGLLNQDAEGNLIPGVAESWEASEGNTVYTFKLRDNAKWSNGDPVTAGDFVYAWRRAADPETASPYAWYMELMSLENGKEVIAGEKDPSELGVEAVDDHTLRVKLTSALPYFPSMVTHATTFPTHQATIEEHGDAWTRPENMVSNGAYVLTEWVLNERTTRERNEMYWNNDATILDKVVTLVINDDNVALTRWRAGELDKTEVPAGQYPALKEEFPDQAHSFPRLCNYYYTFNLSDSGPEAFKDVRVRKALSYAVDRKVITDQVLQGGQFQAYTFTPAATAGFEVPDVDFAGMTQAERDEKAKELLAEAGYGPDNPLEFDMLYNTSEGHKRIAVAISQMWKQKLGVEATLGNMEWKTFLETRGNQDFELARGAWCGDYNEASTFLDLLTTPSGYNDGKYSNEEVDQLMADAKTAENPQENYTRVEQILAEEMPVIPVYHYTGVMMLKDNVKGWPFENVEQNWYSRDLYKVAE
ncbi:peptide ABC transporter substrate-binding protein [Maritalea mediterranea]|uniref:Peptide ABC transporter substrate-binding protein n=1 Tax=Maritalea mediterranea TaxID=2909667 RepID=A0ABS9E9P7_9HYPH|nr:peptide ABC transporter substrate-binding protein [Maritalea mediterranea]MCF4099612.1 peptide ABC transporter substrate-binding protein [Maritalea mediterranea]